MRRSESHRIPAVVTIGRTRSGKKASRNSACPDQKHRSGGGTEKSNRLIQRPVTAMPTGSKDCPKSEQSEKKETRSTDDQRAVRQGDSAEDGRLREPERKGAGDQDRREIPHQKHPEARRDASGMPADRARPPVPQR